MDINHIQLQIIERRAQRSQRPINQQHGIWNSFNNNHYHMLYELLEAPLTFNPVNYHNVLRRTNAVLTPAAGDDVPENQDVDQNHRCDRILFAMCKFHCARHSYYFGSIRAFALSRC